MSTIHARLKSKLANYPVRKWFDVAIRELAVDLRDMLLATTGISLGGLMAVGTTVTATALGVICDAVDAKLGGNLKLQLAALVTNVDLFATAGDVAQAIYSDGTDASGADLVAASGATAYVTAIVVDSDGAGAATGDNGAMLYLALMAGTAATFGAATTYLTDAEIDAALAASTGVHDGTTGWARLADILWDEGTSSPVATVVPNRDA
jgi:hypothetical protein